MFFLITLNEISTIKRFLVLRLNQLTFCRKNCRVKSSIFLLRFVKFNSLQDVSPNNSTLPEFKMVNKNLFYLLTLNFLFVFIELILK